MSFLKSKNFRKTIFGAAIIMAANSAIISNALAQNIPQEKQQAIKKVLAERIPVFSDIAEIRAAPIAGLYEVRIENEILYTDEKGDYIINGSILDTKSRKNLTEERVDKLNAISFNQLDTKNSITVKRGNGKRKLAVFEDPNCGYCKRFEKDLRNVTDITINYYLIPILGRDSVKKAQNIWCAKDKSKTWADWMQKDIVPKDADNAACQVDALDKNLEFARKHKITGTPTLIFEDGSRVPGAIGAAQVETILNEKSKK